MTAAAPWKGFCTNVRCTCWTPDAVTCEEWAGDPGDGRCPRCGWPKVSHGLSPQRVLSERDPMHLQARVRVALAGTDAMVTELSSNLHGEPRFLITPAAGTAWQVVDVLPSDLDRYVSVTTS